MTNRQTIEAEAIEYIRTCLKDELLAVAPPDWSEDTLRDLEEAKISESQRIIDALTTGELQNEFAMQRHAERAVAELRMDVYQRVRNTEPIRN